MARASIDNEHEPPESLVTHKWDITQRCSVCGLENSLNYGEFTTWDDFWNRMYSLCPGVSIISRLERMLLHSLIEQVYNGSEETRREAMFGFASEDHKVMMKLMERFSQEIDES